MKYFVVLLLVASLVAFTYAQEDEDESKPKESWWKGFKERMKSVMSRWRDDIKVLWDDVLAKAEDMRGWTAEVFESLKSKMKEWVEKRPELPDNEKNEIETFISKLKVPTEKPTSIDP